MAAFGFDPRKHFYTVDGRPIPSVTQVLGATGILPDFRRVDRAILEYKRRVGVALHSCLHYLQEGDLDPETVDGAVRLRLEAYQLFVSDHGFEPMGCELRRWPTLNGMQFGMQLDVTGLIKDEPWVIDFKTSEGSPEPGWAIQLAAYEAGLGKPLVPPFKWRRMSLQLFENGRYGKKEWTDPNDRQEWLSALYLAYRRINRGEKLWQEELK